MKKQLLRKISGLTMAATMTISAVSVYASDEVVSEHNLAKTISTKFASLNENDANLTEAQINELSELREESVKVKSELLEKEYEFDLINKEHYEMIKNTLSNGNTIFIKRVDDKIVLEDDNKSEVFVTVHNLENIDTALEGVEPLEIEKIENFVKDVELRKDKIDLLTEEQKNELTSLMEKSLESELKILEKQYEFNLIEKDIFDTLSENLNNNKNVSSIY